MEPSEMLNAKSAAKGLVFEYYHHHLWVLQSVTPQMLGTASRVRESEKEHNASALEGREIPERDKHAWQFV